MDNMADTFKCIIAGLPAILILTPVCSWAQNSGSLETAGKMAPAVSFFKVIGALALIIGLMALLFVWLKKMGWNRTALKQGSLIKVLDSRMITPKKSIIAVQIGLDEILLLGVSEQNITLLSRLENKDTAGNDNNQESPAETTAKFASLLNRALFRRAELKENQ